MPIRRSEHEAEQRKREALARLEANPRARRARPEERPPRGHHRDHDWGLDSGKSGEMKRPNADGRTPLERPGDSQRMRQALRALEQDPLAHPVDPADRPPEGQIEVTFVGKLLGKRRQK